MEDGKTYWTILRYEDWHDHPNDNGYCRYDDETFYATEEACREEVDKLNASQVKAQAKELADAEEAWRRAKADWDALVAMGRRTGEYREFKAPWVSKPDYAIEKVTWREKREGDKIRIEVV